MAPDWVGRLSVDMAIALAAAMGCRGWYSSLSIWSHSCRSHDLAVLRRPCGCPSGCFWSRFHTAIAPETTVNVSHQKNSITTW